MESGGKQFFVDQSFVIIIIYFDNPEDDPSGKKCSPSSGVACLRRGLPSALALFERQYAAFPLSVSSLLGWMRPVRTFPRLDGVRQGGGGEGGGLVR